MKALSKKNRYKHLSFFYLLNEMKKEKKSSNEIEIKKQQFFTKHKSPAAKQFQKRIKLTS